LLLTIAWVIKCKKTALPNDFAPLLFVSLAILVNIVLSSAPIIAAFSWLKLLPDFLFGYYVFSNAQKLRGYIAKPLIISLVVISAIAAIQLLSGSSIGGPLYWLGERRFNSFTPGIATLTLFGRILLRPYATFPHPNVLAGYMGASLLFLRYENRNNKKLLTLAIFVIVLTISKNAALSFVAVLLSNRSAHLKKIFFSK